MEPADWPAVAAIYAEGIATGNATFEVAVPGYVAWDAAHLAAHRLVARAEGGVVGWAALGAYSRREVYRGVAEETIYVAERARGQGIGGVLLRALIADAERAGIWTLQAGIFRENAASLALHERCGFRIVGTRERIGKMGDTWRDVVLMERRSTAVG
ncbi:MAG: N-acetyltransferase family protein [Actinomycetota bacterium]|nr:N-acetyltransferase family protein [Actinomycetota bacterium]